MGAMFFILYAGAAFMFVSSVFMVLPEAKQEQLITFIQGLSK